LQATGHGRLAEGTKYHQYLKRIVYKLRPNHAEQSLEIRIIWANKMKYSGDNSDSVIEDGNLGNDAAVA